MLPMNLEAGRRTMHARTHTLETLKGRDLEIHPDLTSPEVGVCKIKEKYVVL